VKSLRVRVVLVVTLASLVPVIGVSVWSRTTIADHARAEDARRLDTTIGVARRRVDDRIAAIDRSVGRLCESDLVIDNLLLDLQMNRFGPTEESTLLRHLPPMMHGSDLDVLEILGARGEREGIVIASAQYPGRSGARDRALFAKARRAGGMPFVTEIRTREGGEAHEIGALLSACEVASGNARVLVIGGRALERVTDDLATDIESITVVLRPADSADDGATAFYTFNDDHGEPEARLFAIVDRSSLAAQLQDLDRGFYIGGGVAVLLAVIFGVALALALSRPLVELEKAAERVGSGDLDSTIGVRSNNEVGRALRAFNQMTTDLKTTRAKLLRAERIAAWRDIARRIAHEVKNPLSPIQVAIETMQKTYRKKHPDFEEIFEESTAMILDEVQKLTRLVTEFSNFARMPSPRRQPVDVGELLRHTEALYRGHQGVELEARIDGGLPIIAGDRDQLSEVMTNLVKNAIEAARSKHPDGGGRVLIVARPVEGGVEIHVEDNGSGVPEEQRARVFEPYFTTKTEGTGLGLSIVQRIVTDHEGDIEVLASSIGGADFSLFLSEHGPKISATASQTDAAALPLIRKRT
jgi:two-component system nitrogen regulation sensor histidine kinase NtrY